MVWLASLIHVAYVAKE